MSVLSRNNEAVSLRSTKSLRRKIRAGETVIQGLLVFCGILSIFTTIGIVYELGKEAMLFFRNPAVSLVEFFTAAKWQPTIEEFGVLPLVTATLTTTLFAMLVAIPLGLCVAIYLSEYATPRTRNALKPILEILAGIPTIVYGYFALTFMTPLLRAVVLDLYMQEVDGWQVCRSIRQFSKVPILVLSALNKPGAVAQALDEGADDYLIKPVPSGVLIAHLKNLIRRSRAEKQASTPRFGTL